jgi:hypothetical protein
MNAMARPWIGLVFKCLSILAAIFAFTFFMRMDEDRSRVNNYRESGTVSRAVVTEMKLDKIVYEGRRGRTRSENVQYLFVRFDPDSKVKYADFPVKVQEADLPLAPALTGDSAKDGKYLDIMSVPRDLYDRTKLGDVLTVVDAPFSGYGPELVSDIRAFDPAEAYPKMAIALALALMLWLIGWRISKASALRGFIAVATTSGIRP